MTYAIRCMWDPNRPQLLRFIFGVSSSLAEPVDSMFFNGDVSLMLEYASCLFKQLLLAKLVKHVRLVSAFNQHTRTKTDSRALEKL